MTTNFRLMAMAAVAMLAMNSCVKEENLNNGENKGTPVEFEMGVNSVSRTNTPDDGYATTFVEGDEVGIFVYNGETPVVKNARYKLNADGKWEAQGEAITAEDGISYSYYAYYPYNAAATDATSVSLTVAGDQTADYTGSDALMAKSDVEAGTTTVQLQYSHAFALVQVSLKGDLAAKDATVTLQNVYPTAALDLKAGTVGTAAGTMGTVAMKACTTNGEAAPFNYRAIVPAQTIAANEAILMITSNNKNYKFTYSVNVPYENGKLRQFDVTLGGATGNKIEIGQGTISDWTDGSDVEGGTGGVEEMPLISEFPLTIPTYGTNDIKNLASSTWFNIINPEFSTVSVSEAVTATTTPEWQNQANITFKSSWNNGNPDANNWYTSVIGYYLIGGISITQESAVYELSFKAKGTNLYATEEAATPETQSSSPIQIYATCRNAAANGSFAIRNNTETPTASNSTINLNTDGSWKECKFYIHFDKIKTGSPASFGEGDPATSSSADYEKIQIRINTTNKATENEPYLLTTLSITDVKLVPYVISTTE